MIQIILFFTMFLIILSHKPLIEGIKKDCCGNLSSDLIDFNCVDNETPEGIQRCYPAQEDYDCDNCGNICDGEGGSNADKCVPTSKGGYCKMDSMTKKVFKGGEFVELTKHFGDKINDSVRARRKYKNLYARKCDPFESEMDDDELERKDRKGKYKSEDEDFDAIDKIPSAHDQLDDDSIFNLKYTIFALVIIFVVILIIIFRNKIIDKLKNLIQKK